ncbi:MAG TPA: M15 family metallopeptidase [Kofleriaceae bacterium]|nr:M15 family metallopeptidase [Kofleriaceae bacterium]
MGALLPRPSEPFAARIAELDDATFARMRGCSWKDDPRCPARPALACVVVRHVDMAGRAAEGEIVVARGLAAETVALFGRLYAIGFPLSRVELVDAHDADDDRSMAADNTSAFNFRVIAGTSVLSQHALGVAIDLNPVENPMIWPGGERFVPPGGADFLDRRRVRPGMIVRPGPVTAIFDELGWEWGGDWKHVADLHHIAFRRR